MKIEMRRLMWCGLLCAAGFIPAIARAQSTTCANAIPVVADGRGAEHSVYSIAASTTQWFTIEGFANRSYSIEIFDPFDAGAFVPTPTIYPPTSFNTSTCTGTALSGSSINNTTQIEPDIITFSTSPFAGERVSFTASTLGDYFIQITNGGTTGFFYTLTATDTTLFSPRWSTFSGFYTSYGFANTTSTAISVNLRLIDTVGNVKATKTQSVPPNGIVYIDTNTLGVAANDAGFATLTHNGPPGAILADAILANFTTSPPTTLVSKFEERHSGH